MKTIELARRMAQLGETKEALRAYLLVLNGDAEPGELLEAAAYTLQNGGDYKAAYTTFVGLYNEGHFRADILPLMTAAFYEPNVKLLKSRYERNVKALTKYPYLFRKDFPAFDDLSVKFYPYDDNNGYVPYSPAEERFLGFVNTKDPVVSRNFFKDLEKPILASDVFSQYELEYLNDNVRKSEWAGRENHIYLHYTDWSVFCAWLQVLNMRPLLEDKKPVFLIEDELSQYPIDFKDRFGIDYSQYPVKPFDVREINRLIWHTQFSSHNGGDFFNEIFDGHPNLLCLPSLMMDSVEEVVADARERLSGFGLGTFSDKDAFVGVFLSEKDYLKSLDANSRIAPAVFFQPHFSNIQYEMTVNGESGIATLHAKEQDAITESPIFRGFKYIKTFTPLRRFTTSYCGTLRYMVEQATTEKEDGEDRKYIPNVISQRVLNRSYLRDPDDRLYHDSIIVRFEDGKLNPKATFTELAAFLDLPYTESMTYCSEAGVLNPRAFANNVVGFDPTSVYRTYEEFANENERKYIECLMRDAYEFYGYDFQWYDGEPVDEATIDTWVDGFTTLDGFIGDSWLRSFGEWTVKGTEGVGAEGIDGASIQRMVVEHKLEEQRENRKMIAHALLHNPRFINKRGQPLSFTPMLQPNPELLEQPLYH